MTDRKLTPPQQALLDEVREKGGLYITRYKRYYRTIEALKKRGLVVCDEPDYSRLGQDHYVAVATLDEDEEWKNV